MMTLYILVVAFEGFILMIVFYVLRDLYFDPSLLIFDTLVDNCY